MRGSATAELVGDEVVSSTVNQDVKDIIIMVNGTPKRVPSTSDRDEDLVKEPGVTESTLSLP